VDKPNNKTSPSRDYRDAVREQIREAPLTALAITAVAGFIVGGGMRSRIGNAMLAIVGRMALQSAASSFIAAIATGDNQIRKPSKPSADSE
jgi:hypothetical protein